MKIDGRLFIVIIVALALIPGACAISIGGGVSISGSGSAQGNSVTNSGANGIQTAGISVANGLMSDTEDHWVRDTTGKQAEVSMTVNNAAKLIYSYSLSPNNDKTVVSPKTSLVAKESLDVTNANTITANAYAYDGKDAWDNAWLNILGGSVAGYKNSATATATQATVSETANSASGGNVAISENAGNTASMVVGEGTFGQNGYYIQNGQLTGYSGSATAMMNSVTKDLTIASLSGLISLGPYAWNKEGDDAEIRNSITGSVSGYTDHASATPSSANAIQTVSSITSTGAINMWGHSKNAEGDDSQTTTQITNGKLSGYSDTLAATNTQTTAQQSVTSASGSQINFNTGANNLELDNAWSSLQVAAGSVTGYQNSATAMKTQATASQSAYSVSGNQINFRSGANNLELDNASPSLTVIGTGSSVTGYQNSATAMKTQATASQSINYARGNSITVGTAATQVKKGDSANVLSTVTGGYIFLYDDSSTAKLQSYSTPSDPNYIPNVKASADINAFGNINIQSNAKNPKYSSSQTPFNYQTTGKGVATVHSDADPINRPTTVSQTWKDLALMALQTNAVYEPVIGGPYGHVGVAIWNTDGTWTVGAVQGPTGIAALPYTYNGGWSATGTFLDVESYLAGPKANQRPGVQASGNGIYDKIETIKISGSSNPVWANKDMSNFKNRGFIWPNDVCLDAVVGTLQDDGVKNLPSEVIHPRPTDYFYSLFGPDYKIYTLDPKPIWQTYGIYTPT